MTSQTRIKSMVNLDCETPDLAEQSLATILQIDRMRLCSQIGEIKKADFEINTNAEDDRWLPMLKAVAGREITDTGGGQTCWFHATRVKDLTSFCEGIRPLQQNLHQIWASLYPLVADCVSPEGWNDFRRETEESNYGGHSRMVIEAWMANKGPYAFLFAESALNPRDTGNHDYLATSELLEFIAVCFERKYRVSLHARYHATTQLALVKFMTPGIKAAHLGAVLDYLLHRTAGWSLSCLDPCFSANGQQIMPTQVAKAIPILECPAGFRNHAAYSISPAGAHVSLRI
jgi:hypothetical protein